MAELIEQHQIAGLDDRDRGFNRLAQLERTEGGYRARLQYERTIVETALSESAGVAIAELIRLLHERRYRQLRTRLSFRGKTYLGTQEVWIEHLDPPPRGRGPLHMVLGKVRDWLRGRGQHCDAARAA